MPRQLATASEDLFFYWINERHSIYVSRQVGRPKPWTTDPILRDYKFTNVFRQLDRGTVWLNEKLLASHQDAEPELVLFNTAWYRLCNWTGTGKLLGWQTVWSPVRAKRKLDRAQKAGEQVFTGAHIVWGEFGVPKIDGVLQTCTELWKRRKYVAGMCRFTRSLEQVFEVLTEVRGVGPFIGYEIVSDLRHTLLKDAFDINTWANVGPGALRGLKRLYPEMAPSGGLMMMRSLLLTSQRPGVLGPHVPALELREIEHSLCEFDKYCRVKFGEGRPRSTYPGAGEAERT